ncbi:Protein fmp52, mitochondrial [Pleurotus pulmonarius]|nr:Protein fmp52, mitochondrial [Pleurotus pulmonarius]KAF4592833.1 Protein fmp52, mitochondrial [Pleurotus pulmonarius]
MGYSSQISSHRTYEKNKSQRHQTECHDPLAAIRKDRGEKIFACHLASCPRLFSTPKTRRLHLIQAHGFPKEYFFAVTNKGIGGLLRKWGDGASMIRGQWKPREKKDGQGVQGGSESADDSDDSESDEDEGSEVMEVDGKDGYDTTPKASARATRTLDDTDMDKIADSLSSLSLVPASVRFGRGGKTTGFAYNSTTHTVHPVESNVNGSNTPRDAQGPQQNGQDERRRQDRRSGSDGGKGRTNSRARGIMRGLGKSALLVGATGQTGRQLLQQLLASNDFSRIGEYGRRVTSADKISVGKEKLEQKVVDYENLKESEWKDGKWDVVFITSLGTTRALAGSASAFEKIDREYVLKAAKAAKLNDPEHPQRVVYCSATMANSKSSSLYTRSKGLTEEGLASLGYSDTIVFRPAFLKGATREDTRVAETMAGYFTGFLSHFTSSLEIEISTLAKSMRIAGALGTSALPASAEAVKAGTSDAPLTVINNIGAIKLAESEA